MVCWDRHFTIVYGWATAGIFTSMDLMLALMPIKLIRTLNRPVREKVLVGCLMAMGLLTTAISGVKMTTFKDVYLGDPLQKAVHLTTFAKLEELIGLIAACTPCLKSSIERTLRRFGMLSSEHRTVTKPSFVISRLDSSIVLSPIVQNSTDTVTAVEGISKDSDISLVSSAETAWTGRKNKNEHLNF
ncbi:uncharacterized protein BP5553_04556 [Venustampulla echinocandica]|uniref:Rhodopsin domain-containing protein n=1 Tax=Venustampulla echinocandica TaxID=2656787 RepID=A0A370TNL6_9HELO|nr:uncharacterized protein BP5553_04556 [Venustampulla echinocandica]RDL37123.1 hypothetical protein BP5553_04556 [Venustampulla echinocandica]